MASTPTASGTSTAPTTTPTSTQCAASLYEIPVADVPACAMPFSSTNQGYMSSCCGDSDGADVWSYLNDCGLYCLAVDQTVEELTSCLFDAGAGWADVFCQGNATASATETTAVPAASASASVVAEAGGDSDEDGDGSGDGDSDESGDGDNNTEEGEGNGDGDNGAATLAISKVGVAVGTLLLSATVMGAVAL